MVRFQFNLTKAVQAGGILLKKAGGSMDKYLFIKMLYLADRESLKRWSEPITGDLPVSLEHGPVLSMIYDLTKGNTTEDQPEWSRFISEADSQTNQICLKDEPKRDRLSNNELKLIEGVYEQYKDFSWKQMKQLCHAFPEYEEVGK